MNKALLVASIFMLSGIVQAQTAERLPYVRASGSATVSVRPDQLKVSVGVITQAATAQQSADQNAGQMEKVLSSLKPVLGSSGDVKTISYSVSPVYQSGSGGAAATIIGYKTTNMVEATTSDLSLGGRLIDVATSAGANTIQGLRFSLVDYEPVRQDALRLATQQARTNAEAIAAGLGKQLGSVVSAEESSVVKSTAITDVRAGGGNGTPLETGFVEVSASVVLEALLK